MLTVPGEITLSNNSICAVWSIICAVRLYTALYPCTTSGYRVGTRRLAESSKAAWTAAWNVAESLVNSKRAELLTKATASLIND